MYPRFLQFGPLSGSQSGALVISTYGVLAVVAALCGMALWSSIARRTGLNTAKIQTAGLIAVVCVVAGARLAVVAANWRGFLEAPLLILRAGTLSTGSSATIGALLAAIVCCGYLVVAHVPLLRALGAAAPAVALAAGILDVADFAAGAHYGASAAVPWAVTYTSRFAARTTGVPLGVPLHPVQLYAAVAHFALATALLLLLRQGGHTGEVLGAALFAEGALRFLLAPLSADYATATSLFHIVTPAQAVAMGMVALGGLCWLRRAPHKAVQSA